MHGGFRGGLEFPLQPFSVGVHNGNVFLRHGGVGDAAGGYGNVPRRGIPNGNVAGGAVDEPQGDGLLNGRENLVPNIIVFHNNFLLCSWAADCPKPMYTA